jgi:FkbH-like protein
VAEAVRLVVWDLDETFWKGTLTEGGIREYVQEHHDIVVELSRRGIINSICSKNDHDVVCKILAEKGILEYFVFPSINWEPKGHRLRQLVEATQLRAPTVMFIDDNPNNRAEATAMVAGIQVEDETFISSMLADPRFAGKDDQALTRLKQYKLLEERSRDAEKAAGSNEDFLRSCDVRVYIEYDVESHLDRCIELINRTNQLNYTKHRLPENIDAARRELLLHLRRFSRQAGLVRVADKYGDYGFIGFFMTESLRRTIVEGASNRRLIHFCLSCRTLGMLIEQWLYEHLGRPELEVVGDVLTDLSVPRTIDWVRQVPSMDESASELPQIAPQIVLWGGCETEAVGVYLAAHTPALRTFGSYVAGGCFVRIDSVVHIGSICGSDPSEVEADAKAMGLPIKMVAQDIFSNGVPGTIFVFNFGLDAQWFSYGKHKSNGMTLSILPRRITKGNFFTLSEQDLIDHLEATSERDYDADQRQHVLEVARYVRENFDYVKAPSLEQRVQMIRNMIERIPAGSKFIIAVEHDQVSRPDPEDPKKFVISPFPERTRWADLMRDVARSYPYVEVITYSEVIKGPHEIQGGGNHYTREVYLRFAQRVVEVAAALQPKDELSLTEA